MQYLTNYGSNMASCKICLKRLLSHARRLSCSVCKSSVHLSCLPNVTVDDTIYNSDDHTWICPICLEELPFNHYVDDSDFLESISCLWNKNSLLPLDVVKAGNHLFSPFELNDDSEFPLHEIDPDFQYYNSQCSMALQSCDYYIEQTFNQKLTELKINNGCIKLGNNFSIMFVTK